MITAQAKPKLSQPFPSNPGPSLSLFPQMPLGHAVLLSRCPSQHSHQGQQPPVFCPQGLISLQAGAWARLRWPWLRAPLSARRKVKFGVQVPACINRDGQLILRAAQHTEPGWGCVCVGAEDVTWHRNCICAVSFAPSHRRECKDGSGREFTPSLPLCASTASPSRLAGTLLLRD